MKQRNNDFQNNFIFMDSKEQLNCKQEILFNERLPWDVMLNYFMVSNFIKNINSILLLHQFIIMSRLHFFGEVMSSVLYVILRYNLRYQCS